MPPAGPRQPAERQLLTPEQINIIRQKELKPSDFGVQLMAKQKLKGYYGNVSERQFRRYYEEARRQKGDTSQLLVGILETRLDALVYRMKFVPTVFAARQFVSHGHVTVNGRRVTIPSIGERISVSRNRRRESFKESWICWMFACSP